MYKGSLILVLCAQWTPKITGSAFRISLPPYWQISDGFLRGQSWRVLKSWYTSRDPEQGFWRFFSDELNWSLVSSVTRAVHELNIRDKVSYYHIIEKVQRSEKQLQIGWKPPSR